MPLLAAAGVRLADPALSLPVDRTEGWVAGLRLAALSLAGQVIHSVSCVPYLVGPSVP